MRTSNAIALGILLLAGGALSACREVAPTAAAAPRPVPSVADLSPQQRALLAHPSSPEAIAGRPATRQDLEAVRGWFAPGELDAVLAVANRRAAARGEDTIPHCVPLCGQERAPAP